MKEEITIKSFYNIIIPNEWEVKKGVEISDKITKGSSPNWQGFQYQDEGVLFVTSENVRDGFLDVSEPKYLPISFNDKLKNSVLQQGDILINIVGASIGRSCIYNLETIANTNQAVCILRPKKNVDRKFISYFLQLPKSIERLLGTQSDSARPNLTLEDIRNFHFLLPPLPEQKAIARILGLMDSAINKNDQLIAQKELRKKWLMQNLLTGKKRLKGFAGEWKEYPYEKLLKVVKRNFDWNENELYRLISVRRRSGGIFFREALYGHQILVKNLRTVEEGDFLFSKMQILHGASALVTEEFADSKISGSYIAVIAKEDNLLNMVFFQWYSQLPYFYHQTYISSYGVHIEKMTFDFETFLQLEMKLPSFEEQIAIAHVLQTAAKEIQLLKTKTEKLRDQKKGTMQLLLTGKKRLKTLK